MHVSGVDQCWIVLDGARTIRESGLQNDDVLNLQMQPVKLLANQSVYGCMRPGAFAAILGDAFVATWGRAMRLLVAIAVMCQLKSVEDQW